MAVNQMLLEGLLNYKLLVLKGNTGIIIYGWVVINFCPILLRANFAAFIGYSCIRENICA